MLTVLVQTWDCRTKSLSFLVSNLIKLAVATTFFSFVVLGVVAFCFFKCGSFHIIKFLEAELYFCVLRNSEKVLISVKKCYVGASPQAWSLC